MEEPREFFEFYAAAKAAALLKTSKLQDRSFDPGNIVDVVTAMGSHLALELQRGSILRHRSTFIGKAEGSALDELVTDHLGIVRFPGVRARGEVTFSRPGTGFGDVAIAAGTRLETADEVRFVTTHDAILTGTSIKVQVEAQEAGEAGNVGAATITVFVDKLPDTTVTVSNTEKMAGGAPPETDAELAARASLVIPLAARGTEEAVIFGARQVAGVVKAHVNPGTTTVYIADASGGANTTLINAVKDELDKWRPLGVNVTVLGASVVSQNATMALTFEVGFATQAASDLAVSVVKGVINSLDIGDTLYRSKLSQAVLNTVPGLLDVSFSVPSGDVVPSANQLLRAGTVTVS